MDIWKQFLGSLVRYALAWLVGVLVAKEIISDELAKSVIESATGIIVIFLLAAVPVLWGLMKARWNKYAMKEALNSRAGTSLDEVKKNVNNEKGITVTSV